MASTALITFLVQVPPGIRRVDVLGSWDNFQDAYPLRVDREAEHWRGCHRFKNIICDGHRLDPSASRDGALKMGGTYWYYYQLNGEHEHHDPVQPSTTHCPLLPGQRVNVLEVPIQLQADDSKYSSPWKGSISAVFTLDPKAKYKSPRSSVRSATPDPLALPSLVLGHPKNENHGHQQAGGLLISETSDRPKTSQGLCVSLPKASSLMAMFHKMRRLRSAPSNHTNDEGLHRERSNERWREATITSLPPRQIRQMPARQPLNNGLKAPACTPERTPTIPEYASTGSPKSERRTLDSRPLDSNASHSTSWDQNVDLTGLRISSARVVASRNQESVKKAVGIASPQSRVADMRSCLDSSGNKSKTNRFATSVSASASTSQKGSQATRLVASPLVLPIQSNTAGMENSTNAAIMRDSTTDSPPWPPSLLYHSEQTLATFYMHNAPFLSPLSPHYLSQPETPSVRDFEETWVLESVDSQDGNLDNAIGGSPSPSGDDRLLQMPKLPGSCLSVYYLSQGDHTSASTLQKMPPAQDLALPESDPKDLVQSWNDGSFQQDETRGGYPLTDLGYLSKAIT